MVDISYAILVKDEIEEVEKLISILSDNKEENDEIVIVHDISTDGIDSSKIHSKLKELVHTKQIKLYNHELNDDFAAQKNYLNSLCSKQYIFNLDADEYILPILIQNIKLILEENEEIEAFWIPRMNLVHNITQPDIEKWQWHVSKSDYFTTSSILSQESLEYKLLEKHNLIINHVQQATYYYVPIINWPFDPQLRLCKNNDSIKWIKPVHEQLTGYSTVSRLPNEYEYSIIHEKNISKQREQNKHYSKILKYCEYDYDIEHVKLGRKTAFDYAHWKHPSCQKKKFSLDVINWFKNIISEGDYVLDIGAFIGDTPVIYGSITGTTGKIIAFEPNPYAFQILKTNALINKKIMNIKPVNLGITEDTSPVVFHYSDNHFCNGGFAAKTEQGIGVTGHSIPLTVNCTNLKSWVDDNLTEDEINKITFIKIDSEGYDRFILDSMKDLLKNIRPVIATEIYTGLTEREILLQLEAIDNLDYYAFHIPEYYNKDVKIDIFNLKDPLTSKDTKYLKTNIISGEDLLCIPKEKWNTKERGELKNERTK